MSDQEPQAAFETAEGVGDTLEPASAFKLVADETRLAILEALAEADERPVSFSELRRAVEMGDSAHFNYHLQQLTGHFVTQVEEGYTFKHAGEKVIRALFAGSFTDDPHLEPFRVRGACVGCGGPLEAAYDDEQMSIQCADCGHGHGEYGFPPGGLRDRSLEEVTEAFDNRVRHLHCLAADGVCPECGGKMSTELNFEEDRCCLGVQTVVNHDCDRCGHTLCSAPGLRLLDHSEVVSFHRDRGVYLDERPYWTLPWCVSDHYTTVVDESAPLIEVRMPLGEEALVVTLDGSLTVLDTTINARSD